MRFFVLIAVFMLAFTAQAAIASPDYDVNIVGWPSIAGQGETVQVDVVIGQRTAETGEKRVEVGIYKKSTVNDWYDGNLFSIGSSRDAPNCVTSETNVDTKYVTVGAEGAQRTETFTLVVPQVPGDDYVIHAAAFDNCFNTGQPTGQTDFDTKSFEIANVGLDSSATCSDGLRNQDETDTDCGGSICGACGAEFECIANADCDGDLVCQDNFAGETVCREEGSYKNDSEQLEGLGMRLTVVGLLVFAAAGAFWVFKR